MSRIRQVAVLVLMVSGFCQAGTITVDDNGPANYNTIQEAIDNSFDYDVIEVQPGMYPEHINFYGKAITVTSTDPCDILVVYNTVIDGGDSGIVVTFDSGEDNTSKLVGMTIQNGNSYGIYCYYSDPTISQCMIRFSSSSGIYGSSASPTITDSTIRENGGTGIYDCDGQIAHCDILLNSDHGLSGCDGQIANCEIAENLYSGFHNCRGAITKCVISANGHDGLNDCHDANISNCLISGNSRYGLCLCDGANILNCTVVGNGSHGLYHCWSTNVTNCIIVNNWGYGLASSSGTLKYNNVWGNISGNYSGVTPGATDTHENPRFAIDGYWDINDEWVEGEYHLKSVAGRWDPCSYAWVNDAVISLCIDAGDPVGGTLNEPVPNGGRINQGAYGGTEEASRSPWGPEPYCGKYVPADANLDCRVNLLDLAMMAAYWLECNLVPASVCWE